MTEMCITRIKYIVDTHKKWLDQNVSNTLMKGWRNWSAHAAELQTYRADQENHRNKGEGFYKVEYKSMHVIRDELTEDFYSLTQIHSIKITKY